jgi:pimeloyl-ACP methyl ester carboxylesterase
VRDIEDAGFRDVFIVGHSQAGTIIPMMIQRRPDLFARALYLACVAPAPGKTVQSFRQEKYSADVQPPPPMAATRDDADRLMRFYMCNDMTPDEADAMMAQMHRDSWPPQSYTKSDWVYDDAPASIPTTYVVTLQDTGVVVPLQEIFAARLKADKLIRLDCGHQAMLSRPHAFAEILLREAAEKI